MMWSEIKRWAKSKGYDTIKDSDGYYWSKIDDINCSGLSKSVSKLARDIYNNITDNQFVEYQQKYVAEIKHDKPK